MFELKIANPDVTSGTVQVSWCLDQEALKYLTDKGVKDPQVILVIAPEGEPEKYHHNSKEVRAVVPLKDMIAFVEFKYPGATKIWGFVSTRSKKDAHDYLTKSGGVYGTDILDYDAQGWASWMTKDGTLDAQPLSVEVPEGVFAPEPAQWEKDWVNHFFRGKCEDQCHFRKRRLFAYLVQPFLMLPNLLIRLIILLVSCIVGARGTSLKYLLHPLTYDLGDTIEMISGGTIFIRHLPEDEPGVEMPDNFKEMVSYGVRSFWALPFMPLLWIPVLILSLLGKWHTVAVIGIVAVALVAAAVFVVAMVAMAEAGAFGTLWRWLDKFFTRKEPQDFWYLSQEEMDLLVCNTQKGPLTVSKLPAKKRTLRLRFKDLKTKVCRPFAG